MLQILIHTLPKLKAGREFTVELSAQIKILDILIIGAARHLHWINESQCKDPR